MHRHVLVIRKRTAADGRLELVFILSDGIFWKGIPGVADMAAHKDGELCAAGALIFDAVCQVKNAKHLQDEHMVGMTRQKRGSSQSPTYAVGQGDAHAALWLGCPHLLQARLAIVKPLTGTRRCGGDGGC